MNATSIAALVVGVCCLAVGAATVFLPDRARTVSQAAFPSTLDSKQEWRAVGIITAGIGLYLLSMV